MRRALAVLVLVVGACDSGGRDAATGTTSTTADVAAGYVTCAEWHDRPVTAEEVAFGCDRGPYIAGTAVYECDDGRTLFWNDAGWGYVGEPMRAHRPGGERVAPERERTACPA